MEKSQYLSTRGFLWKVPASTSVMVWGAIGPLGYKSELLWFDKSVNSEFYCTSLINNRIFFNLYRYFWNNWIWEEDNAPPHRSNFTQTVLKRCVPNKLTWPARSPDLSPIEQDWDYMKSQISGYTFTQVFTNDASFSLQICEIWVGKKKKIHV